MATKHYDELLQVLRSAINNLENALDDVSSAVDSLENVADLAHRVALGPAK